MGNGSPGCDVTCSGCSCVPARQPHRGLVKWGRGGGGSPEAPGHQRLTESDRRQQLSPLTSCARRESPSPSGGQARCPRGFSATSVLKVPPPSRGSDVVVTQVTCARLPVQLWGGRSGGRAWRAGA